MTSTGRTSLAPGRSGRVCCLLGATLLALSLSGANPPPPLVATSPAATAMPEYKVKAGYLFLFTRYVEWPKTVFAADDSPIVIGVLGPNPFGDLLERTVGGMKNGNRPVEIRYVKDAAEAARCQVVFIGPVREREETAWLQELRDKPVLTVTDTERGLAEGAVLALTLEDTSRGTKVRFSANLPAAHAARLQLSSQMLASAKKVIRDPAHPPANP